MHNIENVLYLDTHISAHMLVIFLIFNTFTRKKLHEYFKHCGPKMDREAYCPLDLTRLPTRHEKSSSTCAARSESQQKNTTGTIRTKSCILIIP